MDKIGLKTAQIMVMSSLVNQQKAQVKLAKPERTARGKLWLKTIIKMDNYDEEDY